MGVGGPLHDPVALPTGDPVPILQEDGWAPVSVSTGAENLAPPEFDPRTAHATSESLYRLRHSGPPLQEIHSF
jgi:hypothetical protein